MILKMDTGYSNDDSESWEDFFGKPVDLKGSVLKLCNIPPVPRKPFKNLNVLSPNVQRILAHSGCISDTTTPIENQVQYSTKNKVAVRKIKTHHNFPLSGIVNKISQSSTDLQIQTESYHETLEVKNKIYTYQQNMADEPDNIAETTSIADTSITSTVSDSNNSQNDSPISRQDITQGGLRFVRPLSTCSTDSSSSSTSTNNNRGGSQYLASIESLADHSDQDRMYENRSTLSIGERVCLEVINTEETYVGDLKQVIEGYLNSWKNNSLLEDEKLITLFCNILEIYKFNSDLLSNLKLTENDPVRIAKCFIDSNSGFEVYTKYCTNYPHAIGLLTELLQSENTASLLRNTQSSLGHNLPLGSYLLKPVQRIMKYHLLLQNLYKHYENNHIENASHLMTDVAHHIDEVKRHIEQQSRVQELEGSLDGWLGPSLTVLGELCLEGTLQERNHKSRQVFLFEKMLLITKRKEDGRLAYKSHIMCSNLMLVEVIQGEPTSFHVIPYDNPRNQITLQARSVQQKKQWALQLKRLMLEQFHGKIPTRAKDLVLGIDAEESLVALPGVKPDSTPEYLERRHERRRTEMSMRRTNKNRKCITPSEQNHDPEGKGIPKRFSYWYLETDGEKEASDLDKKCFSNEYVNTDYDNVKSPQKPDIPKKPIIGSGTPRSTSEPGIPSTVTDSAPRIPRPPIKSFEIKQYNTKTLPKKITKLKRSRTKSLKSNQGSKFYTDLNGDVALNVAESTDESRNSKNLDESLNSNNMEDDHIYETLKVENDVEESEYVVLDELKLQVQKRRSDIKEITTELQELYLEKFKTSNNICDDSVSINSINSSKRNSLTKLSPRDIKNSKLLLKSNSERIGERFANSDYADPKILFHKADNKIVQNSCACDINSANPSHTCVINNTINDDFYEKSVEDSLESDFFRDSAIYSDDNHYSKPEEVDGKSDVASNRESPVNDNDSPTKSRSKFSDGWVKQVVGKFQE